jgi:chaperonin cofactor prefoldin
MKKVCGRLNVSAEWKIKSASAELTEEVENLKVMVQRLRKQVRELQDFKTAIYTAAGVGIDLVLLDDERERS